MHAAVVLLQTSVSNYDKAIVKSSLAGAIMTGDRRVAAKFTKNAKCSACSLGVDEDLDHIFVSCPTYNGLREKLSPQAQTALRDQPLLRHTGATLEPDIVLDIRTDIAGKAFLPLDLPWVDVRGIDVYVDGACQAQQFAAVRLAAAGVFFGPGAPNFGRKLMGGDQSSGRAEIFGVLLALAASFSDIMLCCDCKPVVLGVLKLIACVALTVSNWDNADLWTLVQVQIKRRFNNNECVRIRKVKGHATVQMCLEGLVSPIDKAGNDAADKLAVDAIQQHTHADGYLLYMQHLSVVMEIQAFHILLMRLRLDSDHGDQFDDDDDDHDNNKLPVTTTKSCTCTPIFRVHGKQNMICVGCVQTHAIGLF
jgi:ribonuclease HI